MRSAYLAAARLHHPDKGGTDSGMAVINLAYADIGARTSRLQYNTRGQFLFPTCQACRGEGVRWKSKGFTVRTHLVCDDCKGAGWLHGKGVGRVTAPESIITTAASTRRKSR